MSPGRRVSLPPCARFMRFTSCCFAFTLRLPLSPSSPCPPRLRLLPPLSVDRRFFLIKPRLALCCINHHAQIAQTCQPTYHLSPPSLVGLDGLVVYCFTKASFLSYQLLSGFAAPPLAPARLRPTSRSSLLFSLPRGPSPLLLRRRVACHRQQLTR